MAERDRFLDAVAAQLPFDEAERSDILEELAAHLADSAGRLEADGLAPDVAERTAIERLGPPDRLADELTRAHRSPRRLFAAAGAGTWAAVSGVVYGYLFGLLVLIVTWLAVGAALSVIARLFGQDFGSVTALTSNPMTTLLALGVGAWAAGLKVTPVVAARAGYHRRTVRWLTTGLGAALVGSYSLVGWSGALDWPAFAVLLSLPAWYVAGAWQSTGSGFPTRRWQLGVVAVAVLAFPLATFSGAEMTYSTSLGSWSGSPDSGFAKIGTPTPEAVAAAQNIGFGSMGAGGGGPIWIATVIGDPTVLAGWRDLRVEAWAGISQSQVDPAARGPFVVGPARLEPPGGGPFDSWSSGNPLPDGAVQLDGSVRIDRSPGVHWAWLAITGVAPDEVRYIVQGPSLERAAFNGTGWDWLTAVLDGR
jgi:hypothetical protein